MDRQPVASGASAVANASQFEKLPGDAFTFSVFNYVHVSLVLIPSSTFCTSIKVALVSGKSNRWVLLLAKYMYTNSNCSICVVSSSHISETESCLVVALLCGRAGLIKILL